MTSALTEGSFSRNQFSLYGKSKLVEHKSFNFFRYLKMGTVPQSTWGDKTGLLITRCLEVGKELGKKQRAKFKQYKEMDKK